VLQVSLEKTETTENQVNQDLQIMDPKDLQATTEHQGRMEPQAMTVYPELQGKQVLKVLQASVLEGLQAPLVGKVLQVLTESQAFQAPMELQAVLEHPASKVQLVLLVLLVQLV